MFVGLKMVYLNHLFGGHFPIAWSLGIIVGVIGIAILLSVVFPKAAEAKPDKERPEDAA
jgi:tellurite resistance protein TerC